jgi:hypothetical protein
MIIVFTVALAIAATIAVIQTVELKNERTAKAEKDGIISALQTHVANLETEVAKLNSRLKAQQTPVVKTATEAPVAEATMAPAKPKKRYYKAKKKPATV